MFEAVVALSRKGRFRERICARDIPSREHARKLWPLVTPEPPFQLVSYVRPSFDADNKLKNRSYFRRLPAGKRHSVRKQFESEEKAWREVVAESKEHQRAKEFLAQELKNRMESGESLPWCFVDRMRSDFPFKGDLLLGADEIRMEHPIATTLGKSYRLDVAVLGPAIKRERMLLGGIEIELGHEFDGYKGLISKTLGFPLISVDITDMTLEDVTPEWARGALQATTLDDDDGRRKTFVYLHDLVYPQYVQIPSHIQLEQRHQFLVFASDDDLNKLEVWLKELALAVGYAKHDVAIAKINAKSDQAKQQLERAGLVVGSDWESVNDHQCLRISIDRPVGIDDLRAHQFHATMARLLLSKADALVGYRYCNGVQNHELEEDIWHYSQWRGPSKDPVIHRILPKRLAEPMSRILALINDLQTSNELTD